MLKIFVYLNLCLSPNVSTKQFGSNPSISSQDLTHKILHTNVG